MSTLLDLPPELQQYIMALAIRPETTFDTNEIQRPRAELLRNRQSTMINKQLFNLAMPAYFRLTQLIIAVGSYHIPRLPSTAPKMQAKIYYATFQEHQLYFDNTVRLRVEIDQFKKEAAEKICEMLTKCTRLVEVTVGVHNLEGEGGEKFFARVQHTVEAIKKKTNRSMRVKKETKEAYDRIMEEARTAQKERSLRANELRRARKQSAMNAVAGKLSRKSYHGYHSYPI
jgi:hypothetical protein